MIINNSYFLNKDVFISHSIAQPSIQSNTPDGVTALNAYIDQKEYELLMSFLGESQTTELLAQFEDNGDWKEDALQKWKNLVDGVNDWKGLRNKERKTSLIAYYVYFHFMGSDFRHHTGTGLQVPEAENSLRQDPNVAQVKSWNKFVDQYGNFSRGSDYSFFHNWNGFGMRWGANADKSNVTLYRFMQSQSEDYDLSYFNQYQARVINSFGL